MEILLLLLQILGVVGCSILALAFWINATYTHVAFMFRTDMRNTKLGGAGIGLAIVFLSLALWQAALYGWL